MLKFEFFLQVTKTVYLRNLNISFHATISEHYSEIDLHNDITILT